MSSYNVKEMMSKKERLAPGHRMCAGCGATIGVRAVLRAYIEEESCCRSQMQQDVLRYLLSCIHILSWKTSYIHNAFENARSNIKWS